MAASDIRPEHVLKAIAEFDQLGRSAFLTKYGFGRTRTNWISYRGNFYDAHPIVGVAHGFATGEFWTKDRWFYSGGSSLANTYLMDAGFHPGAGALYPIEKLNVAVSQGKRAPYQYVVLLWAFARASRGEEGMERFNDVREELAGLLAPFAIATTTPDPAMPWAALANNEDLWESEASGLPTVTDADVKRLNLAGGLPSWFGYSARTDSRYVQAVVEVFARFIGDEPAFPALLEKLGLDQPVEELPLLDSDDVAPEVADVVSAVEQFVNPRRKFGRRFSAAENKAIEEQAVKVVRKHYEEVLGYATKDVGATESYDVHATKGDSVIKVEVKGTTSDGSEIVLTANEVALHLAEHPNNALAVVRRIVLDRSGDKPVATGGELVLEPRWELDESRLKAIAYRYPTGL